VLTFLEALLCPSLSSASQTNRDQTTHNYSLARQQTFALRRTVDRTLYISAACKRCRRAARLHAGHRRVRDRAAFLATVRVHVHQADLLQRTRDLHPAHSRHALHHGRQLAIHDLHYPHAMGDEATLQTAGRARAGGATHAVPPPEMDRLRPEVQR
jgi:hypothetical protein